MKRILLVLSILHFSLFISHIVAQESQGKVLITVTPKSPVLPPDVGTYKSDPGKYFDVSIINTDETELYVYFGMQLEYLIDDKGLPVSDLAVSTPADRPTNVPYIIAPGSTTLSQIELRRLFNHIPTSAMLLDDGIMTRIGANDFGLLPEGTYRARLTAYLWDRTLVNQQGLITTPIPLSDPNNTGSCTFQVCYRAQAPQFTMPTSMMGMQQTLGLEAVKLSMSNPLLAWSEPIINCTPDGIPQWQYEVVIKEVLRSEKSEYLMTPDQALAQPSYVTRMPALTQTQYLLNFTQQQKLKAGHVYVAQITATQRGNKMQSDFGFSLVQNGGKSEYLLFTPDKTDGVTQPPVSDDIPETPGPTIDDDDEEDDGDEEDDEDDDLNLELLGVDYEIGEDDAKYVFRNPLLVKPDFGKTGKNAVLDGNNVESEWERPAFVGGVGEKPDTLKFRYHVKMWTLSGYANVEEALQHDPFYDAYVKGKMPEDPNSAKPLPKIGEIPADDVETAVDVLEDYINYPDIAKFISIDDVVLMRVIPECINEESVRFFDDECNSVAFTYTDKLSDAFGNACADGSIQENRKPISISDADMKGKVVHVGEYDMEMGDDVKQDGDHSWSGSGWILWMPFGQKVKIGVKFEGISINDSYIMYNGVVKSESKSNWQHLKDRASKLKDELTDTKDLEEWIPDDIFTEWGLDNLVGAATPDALKGYMEGHKKDIAGGVNNLAKQVKASKYYDYVRKGYAVYENFMNGDFGHMPDIEVFLPLQLPKKINPSPVDIQVISMEWEPTRAWMNLMGMTTLPDNDITEENILMFGAPRTCMDPDRVLPGTGNIILLEDLKLNDPKSDFTIKFLAPQNKEKPEDGCMIHWENDALQMLSVKAEMEIPDLIKCDDQGKRIEGELPKLTVESKVEDWENWYASVTIDPFEHEDLPGWTFIAKDVTLDLSVKQNHPDMKFPAGYDKSHFPKTKFEPDNAWTGLFINEISVMMPEGLLKNGDKRFSISGMNMLFDKSGVTASVGLKDPVDTSIDDWALRIKKVAINILQNDFHGCGMDGDIHVPLTDDEDYIAFNCDMIAVKHDHKTYTADDPDPKADKSTTFDLILKVQPTEDGKNALDGKLKFDFWLATLKLDNKQTYFLLEAIDQGKDAAGTDLGYDTKVELCMAGDISIGGETVSGWIQEQLDKLPLKLEMPGIHFTQMRLSNRKRSDEWVYGEAVRKAAQEAYENEGKSSTLLVLGKNKTIELGSPDSPCYFDCGNWSVASAPKKIGPFSFSIEDFDYGKVPGCDSVYVQATGKIGFISNGSEPIVTAGTSLRLNAEVNIKEKKLSYAGIKFLGCSLDIKTAGMRIMGKLDLGGYGEEGSEDHDDGYNGSLEFTMPGELFTVAASGGYYEHKAAKESTSDKSYSWGYFKAMMDSKAGIHADPLVINRIAGGFYFNCRPTKSDKDPKDKFGGNPERLYGAIGVALGMTMSTTAGEETLKADVDLLVVYNKEAKRLSTFMFNGNLEAVSGIVKAEVSLIYEHTTLNQSKVEEGPVEAKEAKEERTKDRYLCLNVTVEYGLDSDKLKEKIVGANAKLLDIKSQMDEFQSNLDKIDLNSLGKEAPMQGLNQLSGDYEKNAGGVAKENDEGTEDTKEKNEDVEDLSVGQTKIVIEFMITWAKDGEIFDKPKWHLYVGEPAKDKRCTFTYLKFKSSVCSVDIGADGYLCLGNELPDNGALPAIPDKITKFLKGEKKEGIDTGADLQKVERSRAQATKALLDPSNMKGGVMVGASCWGDISINLGLLYGSIESLAGFDASLINYGQNAVCVNLRSSMGYHGWYALGQLYAYLAAKLGLHIKIGKLIDEKVELINAGIGGVLDMGLPNPSWVEGKIGVKFSSSLFKLDRKFTFAAGDHCVPFVGNALDGFEMFQGVSHGSDSLYEALYKPEFAISKSDANKITFNTNMSIGSHYRLVDPSYAAEAGNDSTLNMHNSRTYVFDMNQNLNTRDMKMGVRLIDLGTKATELVAEGNDLTPSEFLRRLRGDKTTGLAEEIRYDVQGMLGKYKSFMEFLTKQFNKRSQTSAETSWVMSSNNIQTATVERMLDEYDLSKLNSTIDKALDNKYYSDVTEVDVSFREEKGTVFHLTNMNLKPGHSYALVLKGDAYEIQNGKRVWVDYYTEKDYVPIHWRQSKLWFFRVKSDSEEIVIGDSLRDLKPYVALAYPSVDGTTVKTGSEGYTTAYINDILHPTIALNRDLQSLLPKEKMKWVLTAYHEADTARWHQTQTANVVYKTPLNNCLNLEPEKAFNRVAEFDKAHDFNDELYHLQLTYTYKYKEKDVENDSVVSLVDLWLIAAPHDVSIKGKTYDDSWKVTTSRNVTGRTLPYSLPFVGSRPWEQPSIDYESMLANYKPSESGKENPDVRLIDNTAKYKNKPLRLIDPYLYLGYLSKWTFIGDRAVSKYAFDDVEIPFGSESLIFDRDGTVVNTEIIKGETNKTLYEIRNEMYGTWNDWYYNNDQLPMYPLPITAGTVGGPTTSNQDGRASTVTPLDLNHFDDQSYNLSDMVENFTAAYDVASMMCRKLKRHATELFDEFAWNWIENNNSIRNDSLNAAILRWNTLHRGQYLEASSRGVTAKVPFYQLPLIFGDCFGGNAKYKGKSIDNSKRSFQHSIGKSDITDTGIRWPSEMSNIFFFRLIGKEGFDEVEPEAFSRYSSKWLNCYANSTGMQIDWDQYDAATALKAVSKFKARIYRVDTYDMSTGQYMLSNLDDNGQGMGGGPWYEDIIIDASNKVAKNMGDMYDMVTAGRRYLDSHFDKPTLQALWTANNTTLTIVYSDSVYTAGNKLEGYNVSQVWAGDEFTDMMAKQNSGEKKNITKVVIDSSLKDAELSSTANWFWGCKKLTSITGLNNLNMNNVTNMFGMFGNCSSLTTIDMSSIEAPKGSNTGFMFSGCSALSTLHIDKFGPQAIQSCGGMFTAVPNTLTTYYSYDLDERIKEQIPGKKVEGNNPVKAIYATNDLGEKVLLFINTMSDYSRNMTYDIKGKNETYRLKVLKVWKGDDVLNKTDGKWPWRDYNKHIVKVYIDPSFKDSPTSTRSWFYEFENLTSIEGMENLNTSKVTNMNFMFWKNSKLKSLDVTKLNTSKVTTMKEMFYGCSGLTELDVTHFDTRQVTDMSRLFYDCSSLTSLDISKFSLASATTLKSMFSGCSRLTSITLDGGVSGTFSGTDVSYLFYNCSNLKKVEFGYGFNTDKVTNFSRMFSGCNNLEDIIVFGNGQFEIEEATDLSYMFNNCYKLAKLPFSWSSQKVTTTRTMFQNCKALTELNLSALRTANVKDMSYMFFGCESLKTLRLENTTTEKVSSNDKMFTKVPVNCTIYMLYDTWNGNSNIKSALPKNTYHNLKLIYPAKILRVKNGLNSQLVFLNTTTNYATGGTYEGNTILNVYSGLDIYTEYPDWAFNKEIQENITSVTITSDFQNVSPYTLQGWFSLPNLKSITGLQYLNTSQATSMRQMFYKCKDLTTLDLSNFDTQNVKDMFMMFCGCSSLKSLDLSSFNTKKMASSTSMDYMFSGCSSLTSLNVSSFNTSNVKSMRGMFAGCESLTQLSLDNFDTRSVQDFTTMFTGCESLTELNLSSFSTESIKGAGFAAMFSDCMSLKKLTVGADFRTGDAISSTDYPTFAGVRDMEVIVPDNMVSLMHNEFVSVLGFIDGDTGWFHDNGEQSSEKVPQVIWTENNATLTFYNGPLRKEGGVFGGNKITKMWSGKDITETTTTKRNYTGKQFEEGWGNTEYPCAPWTVTLIDYDKPISLVIDESFAEVRPTNTTSWFAYCNCTSVKGLEYVNTSAVTNMSRMFAHFHKEDMVLDLKSFETANVTNMGGMFIDLKVKSLDLSSFNTANVTNMNNMFSGFHLSELDLSGFNTANVTNAGSFIKRGNYYIISGPPSKLRKLIVGSGFTLERQTEKLTAFGGISNVDILVKPATALETVRQAFVNKLGFVEGTNGRFITSVSNKKQAIWTKDNKTLTFVYGNQYVVGDKYQGKDITNVWRGTDVVNFSGDNAPWYDIVKDKVTTVVIDETFANVKPTRTSWFKGFQNLKTIKGIENLNTSNTKNMSSMFEDCQQLEKINISHFSTTNVTNMGRMFYNCKKLEKIALSNFDTQNVTDMSYMFDGCSNLTELDVSKFDTHNVTNMSNMFNHCEKLSSLSISNFNTSNVTNMSNMFNGFKGTSLIFSFNTSNVTNMSHMFKDCSNLTSINIANFDLNKVSNLSYMFYGCSSITRMDIWRLGTSTELTDMSYMFKDCKKLTEVNIYEFNTQKVKNMKELFSGCSNLSDLTVGSNFSVSSLSSKQSGVFSGVTGLNIHMPETLYKDRDAIFVDKLGFIKDRSNSGNGYLSDPYHDDPNR